ncbi:MAG TPA: MFS transporter [Anaerolineales bacterium]|nr:MFS transporter [Anaerolineales bacterium]
MQSTPHKLILALSYLTFLLFGMFTAAIGPTLGELSHQTGASLAAIGGVLTCLFLGSVIAQLAGGPLNDRLGYKPVLVASMAVMAVGVVAFTNARSLPLMFALALIAGLGQGGVDMGANLVVADAAPRNTTSALNLLHFFFGLGAFIGPALVGFAILLTGAGLIVQWIIAVLFAVLAVTMAFMLRPGAAAQRGARDADGAKTIGLGIYLSPLLWLMGALMLIYVGVELGLGSWISTYMGISTGMLAQYGAWVTSAYWAALAVGRLAGAAASKSIGRVRLLAIALTGSLLGGIALFFSRQTEIPTVLSLVWIAFFYGTVYPTTVALAASAFPRDTGKALGILVALGSIGAAALPLLAGQLLEQSIAGYLWFVVVGLALLPMLLLGIGRLTKAPSSPVV